MSARTPVTISSTRSEIGCAITMFTPGIVVRRCANLLGDLILRQPFTFLGRRRLIIVSLSL